MGTIKLINQLKIRKPTLTKMSNRVFQTYTYRIVKRPMSQYDFQINKDVDHLPKVKNVSFGGAAWMKLHKNDEIMRINDRPTWNLDQSQINKILEENENHIDVTFRRQ